MLKRAHEVIASGNERSIVDFAVEANRLIAQTTSELEQVKAHLRQRALARERTAEGAVEIEGNLGVASVTFSRPDVRARRDHDLKDIEVNLSPEVFRRLFVKEVVVRPVGEIAQLMEQLSPADRAVLDQFVEVRDSTPKVYLTK